MTLLETMVCSKKKGLTGCPVSPFGAESQLLLSSGSSSLLGLAACTVSGMGSAGLWPHAVLVHLGRALYVAVEAGAGRNQVVLHLLTGLGTSPNLRHGKASMPFSLTR